MSAKTYRKITKEEVEVLMYKRLIEAWVAFDQQSPVYLGEYDPAGSLITVEYDFRLK